MSTRYIYDIYNAAGISISSSTEESWSAFDNYPSVWGHVCKRYSTTTGKNRNGDTIAVYTPVAESSTQLTLMPETHYMFDTAEYPFLIMERYASVNGSKLIESCEVFYNPTGAYWHVKCSSTQVKVANSDSRTDPFSWTTAPSGTFLSFRKEGGKPTCGTTLLGTESSNKSGASGAFYSGGWKWRVYKGSDTIDPLSVTYRENTLYKGEPVTVQVEARTPTYGGTISYQYQYSVDGGKTWTNAGSKTTETSLEITVPAEAKQFQARVLASDNYGFTSTTYVNGPAVGVSQLKAYGGRDGKARSVLKMYSGVNGKARTVVKSYIGIGGKARKFL